jgi:hypothetical protein
MSASRWSASSCATPASLRSPQRPNSSFRSRWQIRTGEPGRHSIDRPVGIGCHLEGLALIPIHIVALVGRTHRDCAVAARVRRRRHHMIRIDGRMSIAVNMSLMEEEKSMAVGRGRQFFRSGGKRRTLRAALR